MPLLLQLHIVMMSKYSKFVVDTLKPMIIFEKWATLKLLHDNDDNIDNYDLVILIAQLFLPNRQSKNDFIQSQACFVL